jgi:DNA-binding LacI/PurR family transcriptional regulator
MNIYDVARLAGVSLSTASKALNGRKDVKESTRQRVVEVARRIDYHPSHLARGLARRRTGNLGLVALRRPLDTIIVNPFYSRVIEGVEAECMERGVNMLFSVQPWAAEGQAQAPKMVREKSVDGLLLLGGMPQGFLDEMASCGIPAVGVDCFSRGAALNAVQADNAQGASLAAAHLAGLGHRLVGMLAGPADDLSFAQRRDAFIQACQQRGLQVRLVEPPGDYAADEPAWKLPMLREPRPTAVFCANDDHAFHFTRQCQQAGLSVPKDISIIGFDDVDMACYFHPPLTTLRVPKREMGAQAVQRLMQLIEKPDQPPQALVLPVELVLRESCAAA